MIAVRYICTLYGAERDFEFRHPDLVPEQFNTHCFSQKPGAPGCLFRKIAQIHSTPNPPVPDARTRNASV